MKMASFLHSTSNIVSSREKWLLDLTSGAAEDVMKAVDEETGDAGGFSEDVGGNATLQLFRAIKHRNMDAVRQAAKIGLKNLGAAGGAGAGSDMWAKSFFGHPLTVQPIRSSPLDQENHLLLFDVEALVRKYGSLIMWFWSFQWLMLVSMIDWLID